MTTAIPAFTGTVPLPSNIPDKSNILFYLVVAIDKSEQGWRIVPYYEVFWLPIG